MGNNEVVPTGKCVAVSVHIKIFERSQINSFVILLKALERQEQIPTKKVDRKKYSKPGLKLEKSTTQMINKANGWFSEKVKKINKPLAVTKKKERTKLTKLEMEKVT